ncbi:hypothetical protein IFM61606_09662 [Aspergillus udagawae]|uniref:Rhodopsin domain-containing protein n=1 Tax=Aspergillus udagawae TaxID=91492 RepID=A0ABQ1BED0_9EURO|nr:hypothetical protein IFM61606_09662 [Aspergillus udagawae]GFF52788.1 hypothetical protein IFM51744_07939 [Aspergillus udagawae]GFF99907.1 hypothetical protein IFM53868_10513 [Aspergillus udagawae]GFG20730.1 hypothetical protein IFM5058_10754 [Aspergillus udagawae]
MASDSEGPVVMGISIAFAIVTFVVVCLRMFARVVVLEHVGVDDYLILCACLLSWAFIAVTIVSVKKGLGSHLVDVDKNNLPSYSFVVWLSSMFYLACLGFIKTSVCWFYTRIGDRTLTRMSLIMMGIVGTQAAVFVMVAAFQCRPIPKAWNASLPGHCVEINIFYLSNAALNILTDLLTYSLPINVLLKLQMPVKQKFALGFILCLGLFACIASIVRITFIPTMLTSADFTYAIGGAMYWSMIETNVGIPAASIPSFKAIASRFLPRLIGEYSSGRKYASSKMTGSKQTHWGFSRFKDSATMNSLRTKDAEDMPTQLGIGYGSNTSEERIVVPNGKIWATTQIETNVEFRNTTTR